MHSLFFLSLLSFLASDIPVSIPPGFKLTLHAGPQLADNIYSITISPRRHLVAASRNYIHVLIDDNQDGTADRSVPFSATPKDGAMSLLWEGDHLYCPGDGHLLRFTDANHDNQADGPPEKLIPLKTGGEHTAHAVKRGPDGWLYILCGDGTGIDKSFVQGTGSPITDPTAGCVVRISPDWKTRHIVVDGLRNAYGMDWNCAGELFTYDSDNERCVSLPWYEGTRFYHLWEGGHCGWRSSTEGRTMFRYPPYFLDVIPPLADLGRGSPTGVVCYRHLQFPEDYRDGLFLLDWTFGKIYFARLKPHGATYTASIETFLEATGDNGMAPTDAVVDTRTGDLYFSIGGRGTRGSIYCVRYLPGKRDFSTSDLAVRNPKSTRLIEQPPKEILKTATGSNLLSCRAGLDAMIAQSAVFTDSERVEAIHANWNETDRSIRQATARLIACCSPETIQQFADSARTAATASTVGLSCRPDAAAIRRAFALSDEGASEQERLDGLRLLQRCFGELPDAASIGSVWEGYFLPDSVVASNPHANDTLVKLTARFPNGNTRRNSAALAEIRTIAGNPPPAPSESPINWELARTLALFGSADSLTYPQLLDRIQRHTSPVSDTHYLACLARLVGRRSPTITERTAAALLDLQRKINEQQLARDRNWSLRVGEIFHLLAVQDPALPQAILQQPGFGGADDLIFVYDPIKAKAAALFQPRKPNFENAPPIDEADVASIRRAAAERFLRRAVEEDGYAWSASLIQLFGELPAETILPILRSRWDDLGLRDAILERLAQTPVEEDRIRFREGLASPQLKTVSHCLSAIERLPVRSQGDDIAALVDGLRRLPEGKETAKLREHFLKVLRGAAGQENLGDDKNAWLAWAIQKYPEFAAKLENAGGVDLPKWRSRWSGIDWSKGNIEHGREAFRKLACVQCHSGAKALGPDLAGSSGRYTRDDLMTAIVAPSRDVPERYRTLLVASDDGNVYQGLVIYESVEALLLQTSPDKTVRLNGSQVVSRQLSDKSLMPDSLLDKASDADIADLIAYIRSLGAPPPK